MLHPQPTEQAPQDTGAPIGTARVAAVVVTYRRPDSLARVLLHLAAQSHRLSEVVVVDNAGDASTAKVLREYSKSLTALEWLRPPTNLGGSGGFARGIEHAFRSDRATPSLDAAWLMDDDCVPALDALERLLAAPLSPSALRAPAPCSQAGVLCFPHVVGRFNTERRRLDREKVLLHPPAGHPHLTFAGFLGLLVPREAYEKLGAPRGDLFFQYDDVDYSLRAQRAGLELRLVPESRVEHPAMDVRTLEIFRRRFRISLHAPDKLYYYIRNRTLIHRHHLGLWLTVRKFIPLDLLAAVLRCQAAGSVKPIQRTLKGLADGLRGRLDSGPCAPPERSRPRHVSIGTPPKDTAANWAAGVPVVDQAGALRQVPPDLLGIPLTTLSLADVKERVTNLTEGNKASMVAALNLDHLRLLESNAVFRTAYDLADLVVPDGQIIVWLSRWLRGRPVPDRVTGTKLVELLAEHASRANCPIFLLGAEPGVARRAAKKLQKRWPGTVIVGAHGGISLATLEDPRALEHILGLIEKAKPKVLLAAFGSPHQEIFIARHLHRLGSAGVRLAVGVGGSFDFISGLRPRAPRPVQRAGLEWLYRLLLEPRHRWRRCVADIAFLFRCLLSQRND